MVGARRGGTFSPEARVDRRFFFVLGLSCFSESVRFRGTNTAVLLAVASFALAGCAATITSKDRSFFKSAAPLVLIVFGLPGLWLLVQLLPLPWFGNSVWASVQMAFDTPLSVSISIDRPATWLELGDCLLAATIFLTATSIGLERDDAQWFLPSLAIVASGFGLVIALGLDGPAAATGALVDVAALTVLLAASEGLNLFERLQAGSRRTNPVLRIALVSASSITAVTICIATLGWRGVASGIVPLAGGMVTLLLLYTIRRFRLGVVSAALALLVLFGVSVGALANLQTIHGSPLIAFASADPSRLERADRMIADAPRLGIGGGAFVSIEGLYRGIRETRLEHAPTFAAKQAVELGLVPMVIEGIGLLIVFAAFVKSAVDRTRDWIYAAAGASTLVALGIASVLNVGSGNLTLLLLVSAVLGLAAAQQSSRKALG